MTATARGRAGGTDSAGARKPRRLARAAAGLLAAAVSLQALGADPPARSCAEATAWDDFTAFAMTAQADTPEFVMKIEHTVYDDGMHIVGSDARRRSEVVAWRRGDDAHVLASEPTGPREFGEIGMVYELPLALLSRRFHGLCELAEDVAYPVDVRQGREAVTGSLKRQGESILFTLHETRNGGQLSYAGSVSYHRPRGRLPTSLPIKGWTVFPPGESTPERGTTTPLQTLGEFEDSLRPAAK